MKESVGTLKCAYVAILEPRPGGVLTSAAPSPTLYPGDGVIGKHVHGYMGQLTAWLM